MGLTSFGSKVNAHVHVIGWHGSRPSIFSEEEDKKEEHKFSELPNEASEHSALSHAEHGETAEAHELCFAHLLLRCPILERLGVAVSASCVEPLPLIHSPPTDLNGRVLTLESRHEEEGPHDEFLEGDTAVLRSAVTLLLHGDSLRSGKRSETNPSGDREEVDGSPESPHDFRADRSVCSAIRLPFLGNQTHSSWSTSLMPYPYFSLPFPSFEALLAEAVSSVSDATPASRYFDIIVAMDRPSFEFALNYFQGYQKVKEEHPCLEEMKKSDCSKVGHRDLRSGGRAWVRRNGSAKCLSGSSTLSLHSAHLSEGHGRAPVILVHPSSGQRQDSAAGMASVGETAMRRNGASGSEGTPGRKRPRGPQDEDNASFPASTSAVSTSWDAQSVREASVCGYAVQQLLEMLFEDQSLVPPPTSSRVEAEARNEESGPSSPSPGMRMEEVDHSSVVDGEVEGAVPVSTSTTLTPTPTPAALPFNSRWRDRVEEAVGFIGPLLGVDFMVAMV